MKITENWLRSLVNPSLSTKALAEQLTMAGLEIEQLEPVAPSFENVVVAEVVTTEQHPNADRLKVCTVKENAAGNILKIVCGASNVRAGLKVPLAKIGAKLPGGFEIKPSKIRGEESFGMLCSAKELGLAASSEGLMELPADAPVGENFREYWQLDDTLLEVNITPNRGDCTSVLGLAREIATLNQLPVPQIAAAHLVEEIFDKFPIFIQQSAACSKYKARIIKNINPQASIPLWMKLHLERCGIRSLYPVVDILNYVMLEVGQPMHAFDFDQLHGGIQVRFAYPQEQLNLLNKNEVQIDEKTLVIADEQAVLALAGIMGGIDSAVSSNTQNVLLESAYFSPSAILGKARQYGLQTESAYRFERGVDPHIQQIALDRAAWLIQKFLGGQIGPIFGEEFSNQLPARNVIELSDKKLKSYLAIDFSEKEVQNTLEKLGLEPKHVGNKWQVTAPSWRTDLSLDVDIIEEIARIYGYHKIPSAKVFTKSIENYVSENKISEERIHNFFADRGFREVITYSFIDAESHKLFNPNEISYQLTNPISSDLSVMRSSVWPGILKAIAYNQNRQQDRLRFYEIGRIFLASSEKTESQPVVIAGAMTDSAFPEQWGHSKKSLDFFDVKSEVENLLALAGLSFFNDMKLMATFACAKQSEANKSLMQKRAIRFIAAQHPALHPGQSARIYIHDRPIGWVGMLHPRLIKHLDLHGPVGLFEIEKSCLEERVMPSYSPPSKFPANRRDISMLIDISCSLQKVVDCIQAVASPLLVDLNIFDIYQSSQLPEGKKSVALALFIQSMEKTLMDEDIQQEVERIITALQTQLMAELRKF